MNDETVGQGVVGKENEGLAFLLFVGLLKYLPGWSGRRKPDAEHS